MGKTRLALQTDTTSPGPSTTASTSSTSRSLTDPRLVPGAIAAVLELATQAEPPADALRAFLSGRRALLLLDNFEVVDAAAPLVSDLLRAAPGLVVLVTSRTPLRLSGEHQYRVEPLSLQDAVRLFAARAGAVAPSFRQPSEDSDEVARLCSRLDCLPLAIELAAARTRDYAPHELLESVPGSLELAGEGGRDLPSRQRTLRSTIDWSYRLLPPEEQAHLRAPRRVRRRVRRSRAPLRSPAPTGKRSRRSSGRASSTRASMPAARCAGSCWRPFASTLSSSWTCSARARAVAGATPSTTRSSRKRSRTSTRRFARQPGGNGSRRRGTTSGPRSTGRAPAGRSSWSCDWWARSLTSGPQATVCARDAHGSTTRSSTPRPRPRLCTPRRCPARPTSRTASATTSECAARRRPAASSS